MNNVWVKQMIYVVDEISMHSFISLFLHLMCDFCYWRKSRTKEVWQRKAWQGSNCRDELFTWQVWLLCVVNFLLLDSVKPIYPSLLLAWALISVLLIARMILQWERSRGTSWAGKIAQTVASRAGNYPKYFHILMIVLNNFCQWSNLHKTNIYCTSDEPLEITYSYWDGAGHRRVIQVRLLAWSSTLNSVSS